MKSSELAFQAPLSAVNSAFLKLTLVFLLWPSSPFPSPFLLAVLYITHTNQYPGNK